MTAKKLHSGLGYIQKRYWGPKELYRYIWSLTAALVEDHDQGLEERKDYHRLIAHIYVSMRSQEKKNPKEDKQWFIPIY